MRNHPFSKHLLLMTQKPDLLLTTCAEHLKFLLHCSHSICWQIQVQAQRQSQSQTQAQNQQAQQTQQGKRKSKGRRKRWIPGDYSIAELQVTAAPVARQRLPQGRGHPKQHARVGYRIQFSFWQGFLVKWSSFASPGTISFARQMQCIQTYFIVFQCTVRVAFKGVWQMSYLHKTPEISFCWSWP